MDHAFLGGTGVRVSKLAFGTMTFGREADETTSAKLYAQCRDAGVNVFDCANVYAGGRSEEILGQLVKGHRDEVFVTTKAYFPTGPGPNERGSSRYHLVRAVEASLRRLDMPYVDLFFLHRFDEVMRLEESLRAVEDLIRQGKVLYLGVSNFAAWQTMKALGIAEREGFSRIACLQPMYNLAKRQAEVELLPMAESEQLGVFSYSPLAGGLLSGKYASATRPDEGRLTDNKMYQTRYGDEGYYALAERFSALARDRRVHPAALAVAWVAAHPGISAPLVGARTQSQLETVLTAVEVDMTEELYAEISGLWPTPPPATDRSEERTPHVYGSR
ncbi:MAG: aldo/keto reductase [Myxococcota bacterium]